MNAFPRTRFGPNDRAAALDFAILWLYAVHSVAPTYEIYQAASVGVRFATKPVQA